ncbi:MAG: porin PorA family protein [Dehalococcoidia bacterium]
MATEGKRRRFSVLSIAGLILAILGILWITVIFPALDKMPTDYERTYYFEGTFSVPDPETQGLVSFPVELTRAQEATGTSDGALLIHQVYTAINSATQEDISARYGDESTLAVDRRTLEFVTEIDERGRTGQWGPPRPLAKGDSYDIWIPGARQPLTANYVREEDFRDLGVLVFEIDEADIPIGTNPQTGMDLYYTAMITQWIEPSSGAVVYNESVTTTSMDVMGNKVPIMIAEVRYAEATTVDIMDIARSARWSLLWFRTIIPWGLIGVGVVLVLVGVVLSTRRKAAQS